METEPPSLLLFLTLPFTFYLSLSVFILLIIFSGIISGSEVAFFSLSKKQLDDAKESKPKQIEQISKLLQNKKQLLSTILVLNNLTNITIVLLGALLTKALHLTYYSLNIGNFAISLSLKFIIDIVAITFIILLFGEIIPKIYAQKNALQFASYTSKLLSIFQKIFKPISGPLIALTNFVETKIRRESFSVDQLSEALELASEDESTTEDEQKLLEGIVNFGNTQATQVMTPRVDMFALENTASFTEVLSKIKEHGFSRIPIFSENEDQIIGVLYSKDLLQFLNKENHNWLNLIRKPMYVPESKKLDDLLADFKAEKTHLAIVVDEYGGTSGVITLEDVIEEIVGDISDEFDEEEIYYTQHSEKCYSFEGKTALKDFYKIIQLEDETVFEENKGEAESLAGFILEINRDYPNKNQKISFNQYIFEIETLDKKRIKQIKVTLP